MRAAVVEQKRWPNRASRRDTGQTHRMCDRPTTSEWDQENMLWWSRAPDNYLVRNHRSQPKS